MCNRPKFWQPTASWGPIRGPLKHSVHLGNAAPSGLRAPQSAPHRINSRGQKSQRGVIATTFRMDSRLRIKGVSGAKHAPLLAQIDPKTLRGLLNGMVVYVGVETNKRDVRGNASMSPSSAQIILSGKRVQDVKI